MRAECPQLCVWLGGGGQGPATSLHPKHTCFNQHNATRWLLSKATTIILITICQKETCRPLGLQGTNLLCW